MKFLKTFLPLFFSFCIYLCKAQTTEAPVSKFDQHKVFNSTFYPDKGNIYRSASGAPGPKYWQNRADYKLDVVLDTAKHRISGATTITYTNNSPDAMGFLWLQLDQNIFREDSRGKAVNPIKGGRINTRVFTNGDEITGVYVINKGKTEKLDYVITDTRMQVKLNDTLRANGSKIQLKIDYAFDIPNYGGSMRTTRFRSDNGWIYEIAQWYPRMEVYDDITGWNVIPYLGTGEFYLEYGDFDYTITAPSNLIVVGSGELMNPAEVLTPKIYARLMAAKNSDKTVMVKDSADVFAPNTHPQRANLSWHFLCKNSRDVAWAASKVFMWDAARINLPDGKKALAQSVYPLESKGISGWGRSTEYIKGSIELYSEKWYRYPYPVATSVAGIISSMEYPGIIFCNYNYTNATLWEVTNHEMGHSWFPMIVGSNERKYAWMDEGLNYFMNRINTKLFNNGEFYIPADMQKTAQNMFSNDAEAVANNPDIVQSFNRNIVSYEKPALALTLLRDQILGEKRFDYAFQTYIKRWAYKHPEPWDFFHTMDNASGEDLTWFWNEWFFSTWKLDQSVKQIEYVNDDPARGSLITIENLEGMAMPVTMDIKEENGTKKRINLPVEIWQHGSSWTFFHKSTSKIDFIVIDPDHKLPDVNLANNAFTDKVVDPSTTVGTVVNAYLDAIGGELALRNVEDLETVAEGSIGKYQLTRTNRYKTPGKFYQDVAIPLYNDFSVSHTIIQNDTTEVKHNGSTVNFDQDIDKEYVKTWNKLFPELDFNKEGYTLALDSAYQVIDGQLAYGLTVVQPDSIRVRYFYDQKTGLKLKAVTDDLNNTTVVYSDYRDIGGGVKIPFTEVTKLFDDPIEFKVKSASLNKGMSDKVFK